MGAALGSANVVCKANNVFRICIGILHGNLNHHVLLLRFKVDNLIMEHGFVLI